MWFILIIVHGVLITLLIFFFWKEPYSLAHQQIFWTLSTPPMEATSLDPCCKIETNVFPQQLTFSVYIHESWTLGKPYGIKLRCYWKWFREQLGSLGNLKGTHWNKEEKTKNNSPYLTPPPNGKIGPIKSACWAFPLVAWNFLFSKLFVTIFGLG